MYALCAKRGYANTCAKSVEGLKLFASMAKAPMIDTFNYYYDKLKDAVNDDAIPKIDAMKDLYFIHLRERGLLTNCMDVTSNVSEQQNHSNGHLRSQPIVDMIRNWLANLCFTNVARHAAVALKLTKRYLNTSVELLRTSIYH